MREAYREDLSSVVEDLVLMTERVVTAVHLSTRALLEARAEQPEIASRITADTGTTVRPETSPVVAAVKKLATKE